MVPNTLLQNLNKIYCFISRATIEIKNRLVFNKLNNGLIKRHLVSWELFACNSFTFNEIN